MGTEEVKFIPQDGGESPPPYFSVIIPNWNGEKFLRGCLGSLRNQTFRNFEVILVDNASTDGSVPLVEREFPEVKLIKLRRNLGLTGGANVGIMHSRGEVIALLNNDAEAHPDWLAALYDALQRHPEAGMAASKMLLYDRRDVINSAGDFYRVDGVPGNRGVWERDEGQYDEEEYVFGACGGAAAYRRSMLEDIGLFDEEMFMYCEDVDLAWRAQIAGYKCIYVPKAIVYHRLSATGGGKTASFYNGRNFIYVIAKDYPGKLFRKYWLLILKAQLRITREALKAWRGEAARARLCGQLAGLLMIPKALAKRPATYARRRVSDEYLESILVKAGD
ncbi:MAG: glycosyltransferase family 2 protein [Chloroflexi bacterium]|nr:MAG: glycosyltransferase family 2 protein [Chloroflexota bacterium]HDN80780.1 glycosyltransferase family 2 protein [Chloroflexota bacterium]